MINIDIKLNKIDDAIELVNYFSNIDCNVELIQDRSVIDGKSITGVFTLDLSRPIKTKVYYVDNNIINSIKNKLSKFSIGGT